MPLDPERLDQACERVRSYLLAERNEDGFWIGELSSSALATATAVGALSLLRKADAAPPDADALIAGGLAYLQRQQNADGGWGDTDRSFSNISTTVLCRAAFSLAGASADAAPTLGKATAYLDAHCGVGAANHAKAIRARYGKDRTFSVPILLTAALAGFIPWSEVPALPFELACFPQSWFRYLSLPVVSYALPALIALGQAIAFHKPSWNPIARSIRWLARKRSLAVLESIQPPSGGFLEATPLTSFVVMSLASMGQAQHPVARRGLEFIRQSVRPDGSWPIDSNLSIWLTTLSINSLAAAGCLNELPDLDRLRAWLLSQQLRERHPYTGAAPGAWGWSHLSGSVPDCDDTPGALLALSHLPQDEESDKAAEAGVRWVLDLQNSDGGWPTFCKGWTNLAFDRSGPDLTAHALRALAAWPKAVSAQSDLPIFDLEIRGMGLDYLKKTQRPDGSWLPLWFGNQHLPDDENPVYGTAKVLAAYRDLGFLELPPPAKKGREWLLQAQHVDGSWGGPAGGPGTVEETALALDALQPLPPPPPRNGEGEKEGGSEPGGSPPRSGEGLDPGLHLAIERGLAWLVEAVLTDQHLVARPIGFYFAKLWYYEKLYPPIFALAALGRARLRLSDRQSPPPATAFRG
jgi:squalene-hopene/tetraprenyl-beta-curcumene cyclase